MSLLLYGFPNDVVQRLRAAGFDISVCFAPDRGAAGGGDPWRRLSVAERFEMKPAAFAPDLPIALADRMRARHLTLFNRTHAREFFRQNSGRPNWLVISDYFENAVQHYYQILKQHRVTHALFDIMPHEGSTPVLFQLAKEMGLHAAYAAQTAEFANKFWIATELDGLGQCDTPAPAELRDFEIAPKERLQTPFYAKVDVRHDAASWRAMIMKSRLRVLWRTLTLQSVLNKRAFSKAKLKHMQKYWMYEHQYLNRSKYSVDMPEGEFIYFPLHYQPESNTDVVGGAYADQALAIETLARHAPSGMAIAVKENPKQTTVMRGPTFFERLSQIPNVTLLHGRVSSFDLLARCRAVATIAGTAGWEAVQVGKPAVIFGGPWYQGVAGVFDWRALGPAALEQALTFEFDEEARRRSLAWKSDRLWTGIVDRNYRGTVTNFDPGANAETVARSLTAYLERVGAPKTADARSGEQIP